MSNANTSKKSGTDWDRLSEMTDEDIDYSDIPELTEEQFARAIVRRSLDPIPPKRQVTLRLDEDVLQWLKSQGPRYQTRINRLLRECMKAARK